MIVIFLITISLITIASLNKISRQKLALVLESLKQRERDLENLKEQEAKINSELLSLNKNLDLLLAVYDITKELSKFLVYEQVLEVFKERLMFVIGLDGCEILSDQRPPRGQLDGYKKVAINIENEPLRYLAVKTEKELDENLLNLTLNQLNLALRRARLYQEIQRLSVTDGLTGVYGRRYFMERFNQELSRSKHHSLALSLLILDIDHFKSYNDNFGHIVGDMLLKEVSSIITSGLRQIDMCSRWGGEEFCILLPDTTKDGAFLVGERLRSAIEETENRAYDERLKVTVSMGLATYPDDAKEYNALIDKADKALYKAKALGRNRVFAYGMREV